MFWTTGFRSVRRDENGWISGKSLLLLIIIISTIFIIMISIIIIIIYYHAVIYRRGFASWRIKQTTQDSVFWELIKPQQINTDWIYNLRNKQ